MILNGLILHTNVVGNLIKPIFYFYTPKTSESQNLLRFSGGIEMDHQLKMG